MEPLLQHQCTISARPAIAYDIAAVAQAIELAKGKQDWGSHFYILACRIGPFISGLKKKFVRLVKLFAGDPDGHGGCRQNGAFQFVSTGNFQEQLMVKHADLLVCDSKHWLIQKDYNSSTNQRPPILPMGQM